MENVAVSNRFLKRLVTKFETMGVLGKNGEHSCAGTGMLLLVEAQSCGCWKPTGNWLGGSPRGLALGMPVC